MAATTHYSPTYGTQTDASVGPVRKNVFKRILHRLIEARMRQADEFIRQHRHLLPHDLEVQAGRKITERSEGSLPFIR